MTPVVQILLMANIAAYFLQQVMPGIEGAFAFVPQLAFLHPWTFVTYMFLHGGLMHIGFNMLSLVFFGPRVEDRITSRRFAILYFASGIGGALLSLILGGGNPVIGASAGVFGVMMGFAWFWPDAPIMIWGIVPVPARMLVIGTTAIAMFSGFSGAGGGIAHFAHLGGYAAAFLYLKWLDRQRGAFKKVVAAAPREATQRVERWKTIDATRIHEVNREEVNRILDKINASGVASLTPQERVFLSNFVPPDDRVSPLH